jgi:hypothetical protein
MKHLTQAMQPTQHIVIAFSTMYRRTFKVLGG